MDFAAVIVIQVLYAIASLALISVGLAVIFGMMRVINLAQGEFLMLGAYFCTIITQAGVSLWIAIFLAGLAVGLYPSMDAIAGQWEREARFEPAMAADRRALLYAGWLDAVARVLTKK